MAATTVTDLWELAATVMGSDYATEISDATNPTSPLERIFDQVYDQLRRRALMRGRWQFAHRTYDLRLAPTIDWARRARVWDTESRWDYVYSPPPDSIEFVRFEDEDPRRGIIWPKRVRGLPIQYTELESDSEASGVYTMPAFPAKMYRHWMQAKIIDEGLGKHTIRDLEDGESSRAFSFVDSDDTSVELSHGATVPSYVGGSALTVDVSDGDTAGIYNFTAGNYPASITFTIAYGEPDSLAPAGSAWKDHIFTNRVDPRAVYLVDVTDIALWDYEAQFALATLLAFQGAKVLAKSTRLVQLLAQEINQAFSDSVLFDSANDETILMTIPSAERARW